MPYLKLCRDEPETEAPQPLPFDPSKRSWRSAGQSSDDSHPNGEAKMDSIARVEAALEQVESKFESLNEQVEECCDPIRMADWLDEEDDGPWAA